MSEYILTWSDEDGNTLQSAELSFREARELYDLLVNEGYEIEEAEHYKTWTLLTQNLY